jgi:hypothetical protein
MKIGGSSSGLANSAAMGVLSSFHRHVHDFLFSTHFAFRPRLNGQLMVVAPIGGDDALGTADEKEMHASRSGRGLLSSVWSVRS